MLTKHGQLRPFFVEFDRQSRCDCRSFFHFLYLFIGISEIICSFAVADRNAEAPAGDEVRRVREAVMKFKQFQRLRDIYE